MPGRVLRIVTRLNRGGPLRQITALVPGLARRGWTGPVLVGMPDPGESDGASDLEAAGADVVRVPSLRRGIDPFADGRALRVISSWIRRTRPDLVHTHMAKAGALGRLAARLAKVPAVHTFHGHHLQAPWPRDRLSCAAERVLGYFTRVAICLTPRQRRDLCEIHRPLAEGKVEVIAPGLDVEAIRRSASPAAAEALRRRFVPDGRPLFLWAGRFVDVKAPRLLARAALEAERPFLLVMLGEGPERRRVRELVEAEGGRGRVVCPGPTRETAPWILAADAVVLSSRSEGAPVFLLEAKVLGRPAIVTAVGGVPDLVRHGVDGWWVPPGSCRDLARAMDLFARDEALRRRLGREAERDAEALFGQDRLVDDTVRLYERVAEGARREGRRPGGRPYPRSG